MSNKIVDKAITELRKTAQGVLGDDSLSQKNLVQKLETLREFLGDEYEKTGSEDIFLKSEFFGFLSDHLEGLIALKQNNKTYFSKRERDGVIHAYFLLQDCITNDPFLDHASMMTLADAYLQFVEPREIGHGSGIVDGQYEDYWHWAVALSAKGGKRGMNLLAEQLYRVGNECFRPHDKENHHWSVAYQEILLEAIYLARIHLPDEQELKTSLLEKSLECESTHVKNLASALLKNPKKYYHSHSTADHKILFTYRNERLLNQENDYTATVLVDKVPLILKKPQTVLVG